MAKKTAKMPKLEAPTSPSHDKDYEAESAADALLRAQEIKANPELMKRASKHAAKKLKALKGLKADISSIEDLKAIREKKYGPQKKCPFCGTMMEEGECPKCED